MNIRKISRQLSRKYGSQDWWPILDMKTGRHEDMKTRRIKASKFNEAEMFEICLGAILTQNTNWGNVEKAVSNLKREKILTPSKILSTPPGKLRGLIRPSGYYNEKAKKLVAFSLWLVAGYQASLKKFFKQSLKKCREELLAVHGVGPETADSILLYAGRKPSFVIDAYTRRLCTKYGVEFKTYDEYKEYFEKRLPKSVKLYNEFHALIVAWGKSKRG